MSITLDGTSGITTPDVDTDGLTVDTNTLFVDAANNRVGVVTTAPATSLHVRGSGITIAGGSSQNTGNELFFTRADNNLMGYIGWADPTLANSPWLFNSTNGNPIALAVNSTERARLDASGNLLVGTTSIATVIGNQTGLELRGGARIAVFCADSESALFLSRRGNDGAVATFRRDTTNVGSISITTTTTTYNTSSDYRLKEDVQPMVGSVDRLMALKPVNFAWKVDGSRVDGFLAHEAQEVVPECVTGEKDAVDDEGNPQYQGIDQSKIVPLLVAALQEALTKIEALEARVAALETNA
jgi:hypothetical protein